MKIGILGLGFMGATHATALSQMQNVAITAVCGRDERPLSGDFRDVGGNLGMSFGVLDFSKVHKYRDWRELVADSDIDALDICLPTEFHAPVAEAALRAGKHVICEKPMALDGSECDSMLSTAKEQGRVLMIGQVLRFFPQYRKLKELAESGEYGRLRAVTFVRRCGLPQWSKWLITSERSGGALLDLLVHDIDQALWLCGVPERVAAKSIGGADTMMATFLYPGGPEVRIQGGWFAPETPFAMSFQARFDKAEVEMSAEGLTVCNSAGERKKIHLGTEDPYREELAYFVDCCRSGQRPERCPPEESARAVKVALLLKESRAGGGTQLTCSV